MAGENQTKNDNNVSSRQEENKKTLTQAVGDTKVELKKVHWPTQKEVKKYTIVVISTVLFFSVALYLIDSGLGFIISKLVSK